MRGRRHLQAEFDGPEFLARDPARITALPDEDLGGLMYATERAVVTLGGPIEADAARDLVPLVRGDLDAWVEGPVEAPVLRIEPRDREVMGRRLALQPGARLVRIPTDGDRFTSDLLVLEPFQVRTLSFGLDDPEPRERGSFPVPEEATNPVVYDGAVALQVGDMLRVFDLESGAERDAGFLRGDRLIAARPGPYLIRGSGIDQLNGDTGLAAPTRLDGNLDPAAAPGIGAVLAVQATGSLQLMVFGENGIGVIQRTGLEGFVSPMSYDARSRLGGSIHLARTVWQFRTLVAVDTAEGSTIHRVSNDAPGWSTPCPRWD